MNIIEKPITDLLPYINNAKVHGEKQIEYLASSIREFGFKNPILIDKNNVIIAGHGRFEAAKKLSMDAVPCILCENLTDAQVKAFRLADNKLAELDTSWDGDLVKLELQTLQEMNFDVDITGFDIGEFDFNNSEEGLIDDDEIPEVEKENPFIKSGDLIELGKHRLLCGDSTKAEDVERLMDGEKADMVFTDPPYGVAYVGKTKDALTIKSDDISEEKLKEFVKLWFDNVDSVIKEGAYVLQTVPAGQLNIIFSNDWKNRGWLRQQMVWNKDSMVLGHSEYHYKHEPILFGWKPGKRLKCKDRTKTTVWDFKRPKRSLEHPTMKPVEMWEYGICNHTKKNDLLFEPFSGSGTTLIACEKTKRKCCGMELDPHYCDVIIQRWCEYTGNYDITINGKKIKWSESK